MEGPAASPKSPGKALPPPRDALATGSLAPCHLPGRSRGPAARRVLCPEPRVYGALLCAPQTEVMPF